MSKFSNITVGLSAIAMTSLSSLAYTPIATAFSLTGPISTTSSVTTTQDLDYIYTSTTTTTTSSGPNLGISALTSSDIGKSFTVNFNGNVATKDVTGLTSQAMFTFKGFTTVAGNTRAAFDIALNNTSTLKKQNGTNGSSRVSALGFNTSGTELAAGSSASGLFTNAIVGGAFPNQFGNIDVCFTTGNTCQGGQNGGVTVGQSTGKFVGTVALQGAVASLNLSNFGVRYQSIDGFFNGSTTSGGSGTGKAFNIAFSDTVIKKTRKKVPEPTTAVALLITGVALLRARKQVLSAH